LLVEVLKQVQHDVKVRHPEFISGSSLVWHLLAEVLKRVQHDKNIGPETSSG